MGNPFPAVSSPLHAARARHSAPIASASTTGNLVSLSRLQNAAGEHRLLRVDGLARFGKSGCLMRSQKFRFFGSVREARTVFCGLPRQESAWRFSSRENGDQHLGRGVSIRILVLPMRLVNFSSI